jgi:hypothetical protein
MAMKGRRDLGHCRPRLASAHTDLHDIEREQALAQQRRRARSHGLRREVVAVEPVAGEATVQRPGNHLGRVEDDVAHIDASWIPSGLHHVDLPE